MSLKTLLMLMMKTWLILMMSPNQELLLQESWDLKGREQTKNLDAVSRGAVNRRPAGPVFFLRPNRFRPLSMTHPALLWHLVLVLQNARSPRSNLLNNLDKQLDS